jgi:hypothetical protein
VLDTQPPDPFPSTVARIERDGRLELGGTPRTLVVNVAGSAIGLDGRIVARPRTGLVAYRLPRTAHVHWLAEGLAPDRWTGTKLQYRAWPIQAGRYELTLSVPSGTPPRNVRIGDRAFVVRAGTRRRITVATKGAPLLMRIAVPNAPLGGRYLGVKVLALRFVPA